MTVVRAAEHATLHAGSFIPQRRIVLHCTRAELPRILVHELFHFVWVRLGNLPRREFEAVLAREYRAGARGELGWSAERRRIKLAPRDVRLRTRRWREYCCESFCDTAAWLYAGVVRHEEYSLAKRFRAKREEWFATTVAARTLSI